MGLQQCWYCLAVLLWLRDSGKKRKLITAGAAAALVFLLISGFGGFAFANLWTLAVAVFAAVAGFLFLQKSKENEQ